jgi:hypothetical protein
MESEPSGETLIETYIFLSMAILEQLFRYVIYLGLALKTTF